MSTAAPPCEPISVGNAPLPTPEQLPDDPETLKRMLIEVLATLQAERLDKDKLRHRIAMLLQQKYGPRTERFHPDQLLLFADWIADAAAANTANAAAANAQEKESQAKPGPRKPKTPHGRGPLPDKLPRHPRHHVLTEAERTCVCGTLRVEIGTDESEQVDWQPASVIVWRDIVHKYLCPDCGKTATAAVTPECHSAPSADAVPNTATAAETTMPTPTTTPGPLAPPSNDAAPNTATAAETTTPTPTNRPVPLASTDRKSVV